MTKYKLKKDLPFAKAGSKVDVRSDFSDRDTQMVISDGEIIIHKLHLNSFSEWIEEVKEPEKPKEFILEFDSTGDLEKLFDGDNKEVKIDNRESFTNDGHKRIHVIEKREYKHKDFEAYWEYCQQFYPSSFSERIFNAARELK